MEIDTNIVEATKNDSILTLLSEPAFALHRQLLAMSSATASTEAALNSFATVSLKPLLRFIASECVATMPPNDLSLVDFVIKLLIANKERLEQESRISADRPPLPSNAVKVGTQVLQERPHVDNDVTVATDAQSPENQSQEACIQSPPPPLCPKCQSKLMIFRFKYSRSFVCTNQECKYLVSKGSLKLR